VNPSDTPAFDIEYLQQRFLDEFGSADNAPLRFFAPGRVNLIGDHTDYTGGFVFPCGIDHGSLLLVRRTHNNQYRFASTNINYKAQLSQDQLGQTYGDHWINYPLGVLDQFKQLGIALDGLDCLYSGNVPNAAGLSSSASIEVVTAFALNKMFDADLELMELAKLSQAAENDFVGMQCGIMDQFAVTMARRDHAMMLDCSTLKHRHVPLQLGDYAIVLANTNQRRELNESAYNERVGECARALQLLQRELSVSQLGEVTPEQLNQHHQLLADDPIAMARATHVAEENARVKAAVPALEQGDLAAFGKLMLASHASLRDQFAVSSEPLNCLVAIASEQEGVLGSRLTGGGFGGCTVNIVQRSKIDSFETIVGERYQKATELTADFYTIYPGDGVRELVS